MRAIIFTCLLMLGISFSYASQNRKVLIIGIDGTRSDAFVQANTPHIDGLLGNATFSYDSWHTGITWSGPSWATILTGVNWNKHGIIDNNFTAPNFNQYPPLPTLAKQIKPNLNCSIVAEWDPLIDNITNASWNHAVKVADGSNFPTADSAVIELQNPDIDLLFAYFDKVDLTGHTTTFSPGNPLYINAIQDVDSAVGKILNALYARPTYASEDWLILLVTDHGGTGFGHGGYSNEERHIWWIASGDMVAHEQINKADPGTYNCNHDNVFTSSCVDSALLKQSPVHADITVTALHYLIYDSGINPENKPEWNLDGKSWLINATAINEPQTTNAISIYPNPSLGSFTITGLSLNSTNSPIELFSADGRKVFSTIATQSTVIVNTEKLAPGIYILHAGTIAQKILVN
jgi:predicted AlkP superfamily pyrophosphatase or phosphodiesterase